MFKIYLSIWVMVVCTYKTNASINYYYLMIKTKAIRALLILSSLNFYCCYSYFISSSDFNFFELPKTKVDLDDLE